MTDAEFKSIKRQMQRAEAHILDAVCRMAGYGKHHPLRREFRSAFRGAVRHRGGRPTTKAQRRDARLILALHRIQREARDNGQTGVTPEQEGRWLDAIYAWENDGGKL